MIGNVMRRTATTTRLGGLLATAVLVATACAGDNDDGSDDDASSDGDSATPLVTAAETGADPTAAQTQPATPASSVTETTAADTTAGADGPLDTTDAGPDATTTSTTIAPAADADLPTAAPGSADDAPPTTAAGPLPAPEVGFVEVASFDQPLDLAYRDLDPRIFIVEKGGRVVAFDDESSVPVLDMSEVDSGGLTTGGEQGLLGLAFHPGADLAYVNFTNGDGATVIAEFAIDPATVAFDPASYREVLTIEQPYGNHNGGDLAFGPDGHLYIGTGDGGAGGDPERNALDVTSRLGKMLRIDPTPGDDGQPFSVPADNPFLGADDADPTIWSIGLRNPWKFSFDPVTADLWISDVGQNEFEEIDLAPATDGSGAGRGVSFGWSAFEADARFNDDVAAEGHTAPVVAYPHDDESCSVSGGAVARDSSYAALNGWYVFGDFCSGRMWALDTTSVGIADGAVTGSPVLVDAGNVPGIVAVREGPDGDLYAISLNGPMLRLARA